MKLELLQKSIHAFGSLLGSKDGDVHLYKYELMKRFHDTWAFDTEDFALMYDSALESNVTRRWWKRDQYRPKEMMLTLIAAEEQYARQAFKELFNENKQVENRIDSFTFYADELLRMFKRAHPKRIENNHYQDSAMISLYLAAMQPERYTLYPGRKIFNKALSALNAKESPDKDDLPRFFKLCHTLHQFMMKDDSLLLALERTRRSPKHLLLSHELIYHVAGEWHQHVPE